MITTCPQQTIFLNEYKYLKKREKCRKDLRKYLLDAVIFYAE